MSNPRLDANDLVMGALISAYRSTGYPELARTCEEVYEQQRVVIEAQEVVKGNNGQTRNIK